MISNLLANYLEAGAIILFGIGFTMLLFHRNLFKKLIGMNIMDTVTFLFLAAMGYIRSGGTGPDGDCGIRVGDGDYAVSDHPALSPVSYAESGRHLSAFAS